MSEERKKGEVKVEINLNAVARFILTESGRRAWADEISRTWGMDAESASERFGVEIDPAPIKEQVWEVMRHLGPACRNGAQHVEHNTILVVGRPGGMVSIRSTGHPTIDALMHYLDANPEQRLGQAVYNIARRASGEWTPPTSAVFNMTDAAFVEAADLLCRGSTEEMVEAEVVGDMGEIQRKANLMGLTVREDKAPPGMVSISCGWRAAHFRREHAGAALDAMQLQRDIYGGNVQIAISALAFHGFTVRVEDGGLTARISAPSGAEMVCEPHALMSVLAGVRLANRDTTRLTSERDAALAALRAASLAAGVDPATGPGGDDVATIERWGADIEGAIEKVRGGADAYECNARTLDALSRKVWDAAKALGVDSAGDPLEVADRLRAMGAESHGQAQDTIRQAMTTIATLAADETAQEIKRAMGVGVAAEFGVSEVSRALGESGIRVEEVGNILHLTGRRGHTMQCERSALRHVLGGVEFLHRDLHRMTRGRLDPGSAEEALVRVSMLVGASIDDPGHPSAWIQIVRRVRELRESRRAERNEIQSALVHLANRVGGPVLVYYDPLPAQIEQLERSVADRLGRYAVVSDAFRSAAGVTPRPAEPWPTVNNRAFAAIKQAQDDRDTLLGGMRRINEVVGGCADTRMGGSIDELITDTICEADRSSQAYDLVDALLTELDGDREMLLNIEPTSSGRLYRWLRDSIRTGGVDATIRAMREHADALVEESDDWPGDDAERETREAMARGIREACDEIEQRPIEELVANLAAAHAVEPSVARAAIDAGLEAFGDDPDPDRAEVAVEHQQAEHAPSPGPPDRDLRFVRMPTEMSGEMSVTIDLSGVRARTVVSMIPSTVKPNPTGPSHEAWVREGLAEERWYAYPDDWSVYDPRGVGVGRVVQVEPIEHGPAITMPTVGGDHAIVRAVEAIRHLPERLQRKGGATYTRDPQIAVDTEEMSVTADWRQRRGQIVRVHIWRHAHVWYASARGNRIHLGHRIDPEDAAASILSHLLMGGMRRVSE